MVSLPPVLAEALRLALHGGAMMVPNRPELLGQPAVIHQLVTGARVKAGHRCA